MLEQYLADKGITIADIAANHPELASLTEKYISISLIGSDEYKAELTEIGNEILEKISEKTDKGEISAPEKEEVVAELAPESVQLEHIEIIDTPIESEEIVLENFIDAPVVEAKKTIGYLFTGIEFSRDGFMKLLSFLGIGYRWKELDKENSNKKFWIIDENNYLITDGENPFTEKGDLYIVAEDGRRDEIAAIVQSKSLGYEEKAQITSAPSLALAVREGVISDDKELVTGMPYKLVDETIQDLYRIESMPELVTLMELSTGKKYACGCGHI